MKHWNSWNYIDHPQKLGAGCAYFGISWSYGFILIMLEWRKTQQNMKSNQEITKTEMKIQLRNLDFDVPGESYSFKFLNHQQLFSKYP